MPRFVRNAYIEGSADGVASGFGTGPRVKGGWLSARVTLRTADAAVSDPITLTAGGRESGSEAAHAFLVIPADMMIASRAHGRMARSSCTSSSGARDGALRRPVTAADGRAGEC